MILTIWLDQNLLTPSTSNHTSVNLTNQNARRFRWPFSVSHPPTVLLALSSRQCQLTGFVAKFWRWFVCIVSVCFIDTQILCDVFDSKNFYLPMIIAREHRNRAKWSVGNDEHFVCFQERLSKSMEMWQAGQSTAIGTKNLTRQKIWEGWDYLSILSRPHTTLLCMTFATARGNLFS